MKPTDRDFEILKELVAMCERGYGHRGGEGCTPLDVGGSNGSDHSYRLSKLARLGFAEEKKLGFDWGQSPKNQRGSKVYRHTAAGKAALEQWKEERK